MEDFKSFVTADAERTERIMNRLLSGSADCVCARLNEAMRYSVFAGGKRLRPYAVFEFCRLHGGSAEAALYYAAAVEFMHTMSLIHDDLPSMDNDVLRRGRPTNHIIYGEATAILAGDALLCSAFGAVSSNPVCTPEQNCAAVNAMAKFGGECGMMGGQQIDLSSEGTEINPALLNELVEKKTAALLSCACVLGCIAAGAGDADIRAAEQFGLNLGMAFQITDDILDFEGDEKTLGKSIGKDMASKKATFVSIYGREKASVLADEYIQKAKKEVSGGDKASAARLLRLCEYVRTRKS